jgi:ligand-binding sensor domain-containing protein
MKKLIFMILISSLISAQKLPTDFDLSSRLSKTEDATPLSNVIERVSIIGDTILVGTSKGLSVSFDKGDSWKNFYNDEIFRDESVSAVGYDRGTIWAATWHFENVAGSDIATGSGLRYSKDKGKSWTIIPQPIDNSADSSIVYGINNIRALPVTTEKQNFIRDIAFYDNTIFIATNAGGIRKSNDEGKTWQRVVLPPDYLDRIKPTDTLSFSLQPVAGAFGKEANLNHIGFSLLTASTGWIYAGTAGGINVSDDGGVSWVKLNHSNQEEPISGNHILAIEENPLDKSIWAATWKAEGASEFWAVSQSNNGGISWNNFLEGERVLDFAFSKNSVFVASQDGLFQSDDKGTTWFSAPEISDNDKKIILNTKNFRAIDSYENSVNNILWIGTLSGLVKYEVGNSIWSGKWNILLSSGAAAASNTSFSFPNPFSPDSKKANIKYSIANDGDVTIRIFDFGMNLVKTVLQNASRRGGIDLIDTWDGRDESDRIVSNGVYFYRIDTGSGEPMYGKILVVL